MRSPRRGLAALLWIAGLAACAGDVEPIRGCDDREGRHPVCGMQNPEDLAVLPGQRALLVSQFGSMDGTRAGNLAILDLASEVVTPLFPPAGTGAATQIAASASGPRWGAADCPPPSPVFSPHGIHLAKRPDGALQLLVVNHGGRESIELFEVMQPPGVVGLEWRGCVLPPAGSYLNDVAALPDGGFVATHMLARDSATLWIITQGLLGLDTGHVLEWHPGRGFREVPGTAGAFPNGIEVSADGEEIYVNVYFGDEVRRIARASGEILASADVQKPDNVTWAPDGRLLVASHVASMREMLGCGEIREGACPFAFRIVALDPETLAPEILLEQAGPPMGAGTVAVQVGSELFIGSFAGDRILRVRLGG